MAALDREALRKLAGGTFAGDFADGALKPNIGIDYAPTGLWDGLLGEAIPATGNVGPRQEADHGVGRDPAADRLRLRQGQGRPDG